MKSLRTRTPQISLAQLELYERYQDKTRLVWDHLGLTQVRTEPLCVRPLTRIWSDRSPEQYGFLVTAGNRLM